MIRDFNISHEFVDFIPREMEDNKLYISIEFATASHKCFCGCGAEVVTPISPVGWQVSFDGDTASLTPSIGSWSLPCRSHYIIRRDRVIWAGAMSDKQIEAVKWRDRRDVTRHYGGELEEATLAPIMPAPSEPEITQGQTQKRSLMKRFIKWIAE